MQEQIRWQQENGSHTAALESIDKALQLLRIDGGPENQAQLPLLEKRLDSLQALGRLADIDKQYQAILHLYRRWFGAEDVRTATLLGRMAEWQMEVFYQELLTPFEEASGVANSDQQRQLAFDMLKQSQVNLIDAIKTHLTAGNWPSPELQQLEEHLLESYYLFAWRQVLETDPDPSLSNRTPRRGSVYKRVNMDSNEFIQAFNQGLLVLERLLTYQQQTPDRNPADEAKVLVALADWHLLFGHNKEAMSIYREASKSMTTEPGEKAWELDPVQPVVIPTFTHYVEQPFSTDFEEGSDYIDVSFSVTRYGRARNIEISRFSDQLDDEVPKRLLSWLKRSQFRPRFVGNEIDESEMRLRYYCQ
ncbi:MAG: hypothetical protein R3F41_10920 [Gammaproteobacteria bacterium]|nr:hypothetical protein [Pseudomonadales bacterium]MCP5348121.1 hypothetical protein [Pseudomonadales bacterium]